MKTHIIIDTGAALSLINQKLAKRSNLLQHITPISGVRLQAANGSAIPASGKANAKIKFENKSYPTDVIIVEDFPFDMLFGMDFLKKYKVIIDNNEDCLIIDKGERVQCSAETPISTHTETFAVVATEDLYVKPQHEAIFNCTILNNDSKEDQLAMVQGIKGFPTLHFQNAVINLKNQNLPMKVINTNPFKSYKIQKGTIVGTAIKEVEVLTSKMFTEPDKEEDKSKSPQSTPVKEDNISNKEEQSDFEPNTQGKPSSLPFKGFKGMPRIQPWTKKEFMSKIDIEPTYLNKEQEEKLKEMLWKHHQNFAFNPKEPGTSRVLKNIINTGDHPPIKSIPYRVSPTEHRYIKTEVENYFKWNLIQPSTSAWGVPVVLAMKKDGTIRFCTDYRKINAITKKDVYPLPRIDDTLDELSGKRYFTSLDLASGYWQLELSNDDKEKTAFITKEGLWEWRVMPFGLTNAPATFQWTMDVVLAGLK